MTQATSSPVLISPPLAVRSLLAQSPFLLRPQLLTRLSALPRAGLSRRLPAPIDRAWSPRDDARLRAGAVARTVPHSPYQGPSA
jgi:hypothetical protein